MVFCHHGNLPPFPAHAPACLALHSSITSAGSWLRGRQPQGQAQPRSHQPGGCVQSAAHCRHAPPRESRCEQGTRATRCAVTTCWSQAHMTLGFDMQYPIAHSHTAASHFAATTTAARLFFIQDTRCHPQTAQPHLFLQPGMSARTTYSLSRCRPAHQSKLTNQIFTAAASNHSIAAGSRKPSKQPCKSDTCLATPACLATVARQQQCAMAGYQAAVHLTSIKSHGMLLVQPAEPCTPTPAAPTDNPSYGNIQAAALELQTCTHTSQLTATAISG